MIFKSEPRRRHELIKTILIINVCDYHFVSVIEAHVTRSLSLATAGDQSRGLNIMLFNSVM